MELCGPGEYFHLGCDEAYSYASCPVCSEKDGPQMLADYLNSLTKELAWHGRRPMIWADALLDSTAWKRPVIATSRPDQKTHLALPLLDKRIIMADWQYNISEPQSPSSEYLMKQGFETVLCPWDGRNNIQSLGEAADRLNAMGLMVTTWHHLPGFLPRFPYAANCMWHESHTPDGCSSTEAAALLRRVYDTKGNYASSGWNRFEVEQ